MSSSVAGKHQFIVDPNLIPLVDENGNVVIYMLAPTESEKLIVASMQGMDQDNIRRISEGR